MSLLDLFAGGRNTVIIVGVEPDDEDPELTRVYFGHRYKWIYFMVGEPEGQKIKDQWAGSSDQHLYTERPPADMTFQDPRGIRNIPGESVVEG